MRSLIYHSEYLANYDNWVTMRDLEKGSSAIKKGGLKYLPGLDDPSLYPSYLCGACFYPIFRKTLDSLCGMVFRRCPSYTYPKGMEYVDTDITSLKEPIMSFSRRLLRSALLYGRGAVVVDAPVSGGNPFLTLYDAFEVIDWDLDTSEGEVKLKSLTVVYKDGYAVVDGTRTETWRAKHYFKSEGICKVRTTDPATFPTEIDLASGTETIIRGVDGKGLPYIPAILFNGDNLNVTKVDVPLLQDIGDLTLSAYRSSANLEWACKFTAMPHRYITGTDPTSLGSNGRIRLGPSGVTVIESSDAKIAPVETPDLSPLEKAVESKLSYAVMLGANLTIPDAKVEESAEAARLRESSKHGNLAAVAQNLSVVMKRALQIMAELLNLDTDACLFDYNSNFFPEVVDAAIVTALISGWEKGAVLTEDLREVLGRFRLVDDTIPFEIAVEAIKKNQEASVDDSLNQK